jgi:uncharacterized protein (TIGR02246 family)
MMKRLLLVPALFCLLANPSFGQEDPPGLQPDPPEYRVFGEPSSPEAGHALAAASRGFGEAWGRGDAAAVASHYAADAEWTNAFGDVVRGPADLRSFLTWIFASNDETASAGEKTSFRSISLRYIGEDVAVTHGRTTSTRGEARAGQETRRVQITMVWVRLEGEWKIVHQMIMDTR